MSITCATSGVKVATDSANDVVISASRCKLMSIHVSVTSSSGTATLYTTTL